MSAVTQVTVVQGTYIVPIEEVDAHREAHLAFIDGVIAGGALLAAGRQTTRSGSLLLFRGLDGAGALAQLAGDPYLAAGVVRYEVVGTFMPGRHAPELAAAVAAG
jgi:uncharacterized protein YciI